MHPTKYPLAGLLVACLLASAAAHAQQAAPDPNTPAFTAEQLASRTFHRRAVDAVIWGLPLVGEDTVKQAALPRRQGELQRHRLVAEGRRLEEPVADAQRQHPLHVFLHQHPEGRAGGGGTAAGRARRQLLRHDRRCLVRAAGRHRLRGQGRQISGAAARLTRARCRTAISRCVPQTYNSMTLLRSILRSLSEEDVRAGDALVGQVKIYPLSKAANPPAQRLLDMTEVMFDGLIKYDETFFTSLARVLDEETGAAPRPANDGHAPAARHREGQGVQARRRDMSRS